MGSLVHFRRRKRCGDVVAVVTCRSETRSWSWRKSIGVTSALLASTVTFGSQLVRGRRSANRADCPPGVDRTEYSSAREKWSKRAEMRDTLSGVLTLSDRGTAQHNHKTIWNTLTTTKSTSPSYLAHLVEVTPSRLHVSQVSSRDLQFPQTRTVSLQSSILQLLTLSPDRSTPRGPRDLSNPFVKDRHTFHQAFTNICTAPRSSQKAFIHFFATLFRQHSSGISLVYTKFSTRETSRSRCIHLTSSTLRKKILSTRELPFFRTW